MGRVVAAYAYRCGCRVAEIQLGDSAAWAREKGDFVWIGFHEPTEQDLRTLQAQFGLHELAIEDALSAHQVPKLEVYGDSLFVVLRTAALRGRHGGVRRDLHLRRRGLHHQRPPRRLAVLPAGARCAARPSPKLLTHGVDYVLHALLDFVVDNYMPVVAAAVEEVDAIEERLLAGAADPRRHRADLRAAPRAGAAAPGGGTDGRGLLAAAPCRAAVHGQEHAALLQGRARPRGAGQRDHRRAARGAELRLRGGASAGIRPARATSRAKFAGWAAILAVPTAIAGIYGMNFEFMPELTWHYGYFIVLGGDLRRRRHPVLAVPALGLDLSRRLRAG